MDLLQSSVSALAGRSVLLRLYALAAAAVLACLLAVPLEFGFGAVHGVWVYRCALQRRRGVWTPHVATWAVRTAS